MRRGNARSRLLVTRDEQTAEDLREWALIGALAAFTIAFPRILALLAMGWG